MSTVSAAYLDKVRFSVRRASGANVDAELTDIILQCRADLARMGVRWGIAEDENNALVLGCMRCFTRWQFGIGGDDADKNREDYLMMSDNLRKSQEAMMYFSDEITLIDVEHKLTDGIYQPTQPKKTTVFADKKSVRRAEYYSAQTAGVKVDAVFAVHSDDYFGQMELIYAGNPYDVIRAYDTDSNTVELTCTRRTQ